MGAAAIVPGVLAQLQELLDVEVPGFEVAADAPLRLPPWLTATATSLATFMKGMTPWLLPLVPLMWLPSARNRCVQSLPRPPENLREQRVVAQRLRRCRRGRPAMVVRKQRRELRTVGATGVEQRGRAAHEIEGREHFVELDGAGFAVDSFSVRPIATRI